MNRLEFDIETVGDYYIDLVSSILMIGVNLAISVYFVFRISMELSIISVLFFSTDVSGEFRVSGTGAATGSTAKTDWRPVL